MKDKTTLPLFGLLGVALATSPSLVMAQTPSAKVVNVAMAPALESVENKALDVQAVTVQIQHVEPGLMAWWLDSAHNVEPAKRTAYDYLRLTLLPSNQGFQNHISRLNTPQFELPAGMSIVSTTEKPKTLLLVGTSDGIAKTKEIIALLDQRVREVELEVHFIQLDDEALSQLKIESPKVRQVSIVKSNFLSQIKTLSEAGHLKVAQQSRVVGLNNSTLLAGATTKSNSEVGYKDENGTFHKFPSVVDKAQKPDDNLKTEVFKGLRATATINNDDTVTLLAIPTTVFSFSVSASRIPVVTNDLSETIINLRDGDTFALSGITSQFFPNVREADAKTLRHQMVFVTPRIVRRLGDQ